jgi:predicted RNA-binding Zn ribbon-like protein
MNGQLVSSSASQRGAAGLDSATGLDSALWEFPFRSGRLCLDFVATLGSRGQMNLERLQVPGDLERWLTQAGLGARGPVSEADLADAVRLREAIYGLVRLEPGRRLPGAARVVNQMATLAPLAPRLDEAGRASAWSPGGTVTQALSSIARDAIAFLSGPLITRVRSCAGPDCTILFVDTSRPGTRRWCSMEACGNQAKSAGLRQQRRQARLAASQLTPAPVAPR